MFATPPGQPTNILRPKIPTRTRRVRERQKDVLQRIAQVWLSLSTPSERPPNDELGRIIANAYESGNYGSLAVTIARYQAKQQASCEPIYYRERWPPREVAVKTR